MKKSLIIIALAGLMTLAACKKDKESQGEAKFTATIEHQGGRTSLDPNNGQINWTAGDQIVIANDNNETAVFTLQSGEGTTEGGFGTSGEFNTVGPFIAAYPSTAEIVGDVVTFNLPATQAIGETGTFANGANPMVTCSDDKNLQFKNLCGGLGIRLKGVGAHVTAVRITSKNTAEKLWGAYEVSNCAATDPTLTEAANNQGTNVITLTCDVTLTTAAKTFFVMLPPGTLANGFTMEVLDGDEVLATKETTSDVGLVERNNVKCFNEILIDVEFDGNVEIPAGMSGPDIIVTNLSEDAVPDENGDFFIGYSKMLTAKNAENGKIIYISNLSADYDISKGDRQQNYELSAKETALHYALCLIPFGIYQSKDATFNSMKDVLYELTYVKNLETAIENTVNQYGYLKTDEIGTELNALWNYLKADFLDQFFENRKSVSEQNPNIANKVELKKDGSIVYSIPNLPISRLRGVRLDINANGTHFNPTTNTWTLAMTGYSDNGVYIGVNKGRIADDGLAYPSIERIHYFLPPMNVGKFMGTFTSFSGMCDYFSDTWRLFFEEGFSFADMTYDMAKLDGITFELGRNDNAIVMLSPKDSQETAVINVVYASLQVIGMALDDIFSTEGITAFLTSFLDDAEFMSNVYASFGGGLSNFLQLSLAVLQRFGDFLVTEGWNYLLPQINLEKALNYVSSRAARAALELIGNELGMIASWGLFDSFALEVEAEFNNDLPSVSTQSYELLSSTQAVVVAELESIGTLTVTEVGVCYSPTSIVPTVNDLCVSHPSPTMTGSYPCQLDGLQANTTYYARAYAKCPLDIVVYGNHVVSFNTGNQPTVTTHEVLPDNIGSTWATVTGSVVFPDATQPIEYERGFVLGESEYGLTVNSENMVLPFEGTVLLNYSCTFTNLWPETQYYVRAYSYSPNGQVVYANEVVSFTTLPNGGGGGGSYNGHDYVDLGLPSGLLWATCNVGAETPEAYGDYLSWDNAASAAANWGDGWRVPTKDEWEELLNNTTNTWVTQNGVNGRLFTASNGNSMFLPAAGWHSGSYLNGAGRTGYYWSSSISHGGPYRRWHLSFDSDGYSVWNTNSSIGHSVRPVRSAQ